MIFVAAAIFYRAPARGASSAAAADELTLRRVHVFRRGRDFCEAPARGASSAAAADELYDCGACTIFAAAAISAWSRPPRVRSEALAAGRLAPRRPGGFG